MATGATQTYAGVVFDIEQSVVSTALKDYNGLHRHSRTAIAKQLRVRGRSGCLFSIGFR